MHVAFRRLVPPLVLALAAGTASAAAQEAPHPDTVVFRSGVDVVAVAAVVRDRKGHIVPGLPHEAFEVLDAGQPRPILDVQADDSSPASVALLLDGSGSMQIGAAIASARTIADGVLASLDPSRDAAALLSFDSRLITVEGFTGDFDRIRRSLAHLKGWGVTSLYDAIAGAAGIVSARTRDRRAIIVLTDGADNASEYSPEAVATIASRIDVPVYVFSLASSAPPAPGDVKSRHRRSALALIARATGGDYIPADTPELVARGIRRVVDELRHQYLISFEASAFDGLRQIEVRTRRHDLTVRARRWYRGK